MRTSSRERGWKRSWAGNQKAFRINRMIALLEFVPLMEKDLKECEIKVDRMF